MNLSGAFLAGIVAGLALRIELAEFWVIAISTGFLGAYTTFSTWMVEAARLMEEHSPRAAMSDMIGQMLLGLAAASVGLLLTA